MIVLRRSLVVFIVIALAGLSAGRANAAAVFMWVADGIAVGGYSSAGALQVSVPVPTGSGGWGNAFSVTTYGTATNNQFVVVADSGKHTLTEYSYNGTNTPTQVGTTFTFPQDTAGGSISPQEIAIDSTGNLWTTSAGGAVSEWCAAASTCTVNGNTFAAGAVIQTVTVPTADGAPRGLMINGTTIYVTTSSYGIDANGNVYDFALTSGIAGSLTKYASLNSNTVGGQETGQLRGIALDSETTPSIFYADSSWAPSGTNDGYIIKGNAGTNNTGTTVVSGLAGPNRLEVGNGTGTGVTGSGCDVLYDANYYGGTVQKFATGFKTNGTAGTCGGVFSSTPVTYLSLAGQHISGLALTFGNKGLGDAVGLPTALFEPADAAPSPEPGTGVLLLGAFLLAGTIRISRRTVTAKR